MDIILGKPRRMWSDDQKRAFVAESFEPGSSVSSVAKRHNIQPSLIFHWRRRFRDEGAVSQGSARVSFAEVTVTAPTPVPSAPPSSVCQAGRIAVEFGCGARMTVSGVVDARLASAIAKALLGQ